ncbi:hypothetical protein NA56DRAFT_297939 [Hyaloscypha hepaticicola]|uniref:Yeast cell wall synthesis Kre9/Knh1-like N-terminal domain-containing protein n=1 Tax=Hyaloscypha hepaticicola TaxID=2082293 RepID=A0A2J6QKN3_9HELO|nr:hypothetical protein NA56DRAFT_297939 [Hyaloscypha hepaticicola]
MRFSLLASLVIATFSALAAAQNPFTFTTLTSITAGTPFNITWAPSTGTVQTVTLVLRQGDPTHLNTIETIASSIQNTGSYLWTPPTTLVAGTGYAFEIINDLNTAIVNYSKQFSIISTNTVSSAAASTTATSAAASSQVTIITGTQSTMTTSTGSASGTKTSASATGSGSGTPSTTSSGAGTAASTTGKNAAGSVKVGVGLLGVVGAVMALL